VLAVILAHLTRICNTFSKTGKKNASFILIFLEKSKSVNLTLIRQKTACHCDKIFLFVLASFHAICYNIVEETKGESQ
jgi:hypothetical protein